MSFCGACLLTSSLLLPFSAAAQVVISEVAYDPAGSDDRHEWIEVQNTGTAIIDISKWSFSDGGSTRHALNAPPKNDGKGSLAVSAGGFLILADDARTFENMYPSVPVVVDTTMNLKNPAAGNSVSILLYDERKQLVDSFTYVGGVIAKNSGDTAQRFGSSIAGASPTPGASNVRAAPRVAAPTVSRSPSPATPNTIVKKTRTHAAVRPATQPVTDKEPDSPVATATSLLQTAAASGAAPNFSYWYAAAIGLALAGAGAAYATSSLRKDEWEIEDMGETV